MCTKKNVFGEKCSNKFESGEKCTKKNVFGDKCSNKFEVGEKCTMFVKRSASRLWREVLHVCGEKCITFVKRSASTTTIFAHCNKNFRGNLQIPSVNESANGIATDNSRLWREVR